ncbi:MAG: Co2+/Mg2+ efflux protein ApaG [Bacteroidia bacterium]
MVKAKTKGLEISVETLYLASHSNPRDNHFFFMYEITIENTNDFTVQLLRRRWNIFDSNGEHRLVEGEGVVGETPVLEPGEKYIYNSGCNLVTEMGKMSGIYVMKKLLDGKEFEVTIPEFFMVCPGKMN